MLSEDLETARTLYQRAVDLAPERIAVSINLAHTHLCLSDHQSAQQVLKAAIIKLGEIGDGMPDLLSRQYLLNNR